MPRVGTDEWVSQVEGRVQRAGPLARVVARAAAVPFGLRFAPVVVALALIPAMTGSDYIVRVALDTLLFALLAMGLNVVVGWAGLLDLGYVAFFGFGAYGYAAVSSEQFGLHWPTPATLVAVTVACAAAGFLLGLPSRRLVGDYLAIVTLFFGQIFLNVVVSGATVKVPFKEETVDFTGGPRGIVELDNWDLFGLELTTVQHYFWAVLVMFVVVAVALRLVGNSRVGRAFKSVREDELAAGILGTPVARTKLLAFTIGAAIAGLCGTLLAALQTGTLPGNYDIPLLITIYAMVILGGSGSLLGVVAGAVLINVILEVLRTPDQARWVFYGVVVAAIVWRIRPRWKAAVILGGTVVIGIVVRLIVGATWDRGTAGEIAEGGALGNVIERWVILPSEPQTIANMAFIGLVLTVVVLSQLRGTLRLALLAPALYLATFVWENRLVLEPSITRLLLLGAALVVLMASRPEGLLGQKRVEVV